MGSRVSFAVEILPALAVMIALILSAATAASGQEITNTLFTESFESPTVTGTDGVNPPGWDVVESFSSWCGMWSTDGSAYLTSFGEQGAYIHKESSMVAFLETTTNILNEALQSNLLYTLTFNTAGGGQEYLVEFLAGSNVLTELSGVSPGSDVAATTGTIIYAAEPGDTNLGETLAIRLSKFSGGNDYLMFDNITLTTATTTNDFTPPTPDPLTWFLLPESRPGDQVVMWADAATDTNDVQYFFTNTVNGDVSDWQDSTGWTNTGLTAGETYSYRVKARDKSANLNESTGWSSEESVTVTPWLIFYDNFEAPDHLDVAAKATGTENHPTGWQGSTHNNHYGLWDEIEGSFSTPYGSQSAMALGNKGGCLTTTTSIMTNTLEEGVTYTLTFNVAAENSLSMDYRVQLLAGTSILGDTSFTAISTDDMSVSDSLVFEAPAGHAALGDTIKVRVYGPNTVQKFALYDNVRLTAEPPPSDGTLFIFQ